MKRLLVWFSICLCLLSGCTSAEETPPSEGAAAVCRVISEEDGSLLLAEDGGDVYTLSLGDTPLTLDGAEFDPEAPGAYQALPDGSLAGTLVTVFFDGTILESWPARFSGVTALAFSTEDFDDRCTLYLAVLEDLWERDAGLNGGISYLGVDLSQTSLSAGEAAAVAWAFSEGRDAQLVQGTYEELVKQGYITGEPLEESDAVFWEWKDGILFSITETDEPVTFNLPAMGVDDGGSADMSQFNVSDTVSFDAQKWRSGLGAYIFSGCTAVRNNAGHWGGYTVGSEMIS